METIFALIYLALVVVFIIGMINPQKVLFFSKKKARRVEVAFLCIGIIVFCAYLEAALLKNSDNQSEKLNQYSESVIIDSSKITVTKSKYEESITSIGKPVEAGYFIYTVSKFYYRKSVGGGGIYV